MKYGVDVATLDRVGVPAIRRAVETGALVVVDEIGKMELFSEAFKAAVLEALDSECSLLATITQSRHPWANRLKQRDDVQVIEVTSGNRDQLVDLLAESLSGEAGGNP